MQRGATNVVSCNTGHRSHRDHPRWKTVHDRVEHLRIPSPCTTDDDHSKRLLVLRLKMASHEPKHHLLVSLEQPWAPGMREINISSTRIVPRCNSVGQLFCEILKPHRVAGVSRITSELAPGSVFISKIECQH